MADPQPQTDYAIEIRWPKNGRLTVSSADYKIDRNFGKTVDLTFKRRESDPPFDWVVIFKGPSPIKDKKQLVRGGAKIKQKKVKIDRWTGLGEEGDATGGPGVTYAVVASRDGEMKVLDPKIVVRDPGMSIPMGDRRSKSERRTSSDRRKKAAAKKSSAKKKTTKKKATSKKK